MKYQWHKNICETKKKEIFSFHSLSSRFNRFKYKILLYIYTSHMYNR